jgi:RHS repeat-associated protein
MPGGPTGRAPAVLLFVVALFALAARALRRAWSMGGPQAASREPNVGRGLCARLSSTALMLAAMLLLPATALAQIPTQVIEYYHTDALGSVRAVTKQVNGQWQVVARHDFMPFGEEIAPQTPPPDKRLFTAKERNAETGLDYFGARHMRGSAGRFTTVDPLMVIKESLINPQKWNRYAYVTNNPLRYVDPDGRYGWSVHFDLTRVLAMAAGYDLSTATEVAEADEAVDKAHNAYVPSNQAQWHFPSPARVSELKRYADGGGVTEVGEYLHAAQDEKSHDGYPLVIGHAFAGHRPDETWRQPEKAMGVAYETFEALKQFKSKLGQTGTTLRWNDFEDLVHRMIVAKTAKELSAAYTDFVEYIQEQTAR